MVVVVVVCVVVRMVVVGRVVVVVGFRVVVVGFGVVVGRVVVVGIRVVVLMIFKFIRGFFLRFKMGLFWVLVRGLLCRFCLKRGRLLGFITGVFFRFEIK